MDGNTHLEANAVAADFRVHESFAATPAQALRTMRSFDGPILLDLDETLYLRSSTEDFIDTAWPKPVAFALVRLIEVLAPWRWMGGERVRDNFRVGLMLLLFPWTLLIWNRRVSHLAKAHANTELLLLAQERAERVRIVTNGFGPVVIPLIRALGLGNSPIVAARVFRFIDRSDGKLELAVARLGRDCVGSSLVITDSQDDMPLLARATLGLWTRWEGARFRPAFAGFYYPGRYLSTVKRPGAGYMRRVILQDDLVLWVLCAAGLAAAPLSHVAGLLLLMLSFWAVYEQGYVDNDLIGWKYESNPRLSGEFHTSELSHRRWEPWIWAAVLGIAGIGMVHRTAIPDPATVATWFAVLGGTFACFCAFNRLDKRTRVWPYAALQLARSGAFALAVPIIPVAVAAIGASVIQKWLPYFFYRIMRQPDDASHSPQSPLVAWEMPLHSVRLLFFFVLACILSLGLGFQEVFDWQAWAILCFFGFKARRELRVLIRDTQGVRSLAK